jgi:hypothetical protein
VSDDDVTCRSDDNKSSNIGIEAKVRTQDVSGWYLSLL